MRALFVLVGLSLAIAGGASAASTAVVATPTPKPSLHVFDGRVWRCEGAVCAAAGAGRSQGLVRECTRAARKLGPLVSYSREGVALDKADLDRCNREARVR